MAQTTDRPNIVIVMADDMGYGDVSSYNSYLSAVATPNIDALAAAGMRFTDAHTPSAVCSPTRYGLLTGDHNFRIGRPSGVQFNYGDVWVAPTKRTVAQVLREAGYTTGFVGKWHLGYNVYDARGNRITGDPKDQSIVPDWSRGISDDPNERGFDYSFGHVASADISPYKYFENGAWVTSEAVWTPRGGGSQIDQYDGSVRPGWNDPDGNFNTIQRTLQTKALQFINDNAGGEKPFFLYVPLSAPHTPDAPHPDFLGDTTHRYTDYVKEVDSIVGNVVQALADIGSAATLVDFDFSGLPGDDFGPLTAINSIDPGVTLVNGVESTGGHGIGGGGVETGQFNWAGWIGGDDRAYMKLVLQATTPGAAIAVSSMDISALRNGGGAPMEWYVWVVDGDFTDTGTNLDTADALDMVEITNDRNVAPTFDPFTFDLSGGAAKMGTFSIVMGAEQGGAGSGGVGNLRFNDLVINGPGESRVPSLVIDRQTGAMTLDNPAGGGPLPLLGYSITSNFGALDQSDWVTISGNYDAAGDGSIDPDDAWTILTAPGSSGDLSEAELVGGDGGAIAPGTQLDFGKVWLPAPTEDVRIELLSQTGAQVRMGVQYTGDPIANGDLNADGAIDVNDWVAFLVGLNDDVPGISPAAAYQRGDLVNNDLVTDHADFLEFQQLYDAANGAGSFAAMVASVPEPTSGCMMMIGIFVVGLGFVRRRVSRPARRMLVLLILATGLGISLAAAQQATAASVEWGNIFEIFSDADIDTSGEILAAINGGPAGADDIHVTIGDTVLNFVSPTPSVLPTANAAAGVPATGNLDLDAVFGSQTLTTTAEPLGLFTLSGLDPGQDYQVQIVAGADSRDCCSARTQFFQDTEDGSGNNFNLLSKATDLTASGTLRANSVIGTFTADADTQDLWINGEINPAMTAYVVSAIGNIPRLTDVNLDTVDNGLDVDPFVDVLLNGPFQAEADMNLDEVVNGLDVDPFVAAVVGGGLRAVPEPSTLALVALAGLAMVLRISKGTRLMMRFSFLPVLAAGLLVALIGSTAPADSTLDRSYLFGDSTGVPAQNENATAGQKIGSGAGGVTFDIVSVANNPKSDNDAQNLSPSTTAGPTYVGVGQGPFRRTVDDGDPTPPAAGDLGAQFSGSGEYLRGARLGLPETAAGSIGYGEVLGGAVWNPNDYTGISNRGYQLWVYPTSAAAAQTVVMDTNQHGVRVSADGNWSMRYNGNDVDSAMPVATGQWSHVMLVRPFGAAGGSQLYVDGVVAAATGGNYNGDDNASLVLGSNAARDADGNFTGGTEEFFSGVLDNLEMFVLGTNTSDPSTDYGTFDAQRVTSISTALPT